MNPRPAGHVEFALNPGVQRGDSAFLLNQGRHRFFFDSFPGRYLALGFAGPIGGRAAIAVIEALEANRALVDAGKAAFFVVTPEPGVPAQTELRTKFSSIRFLWGGESMARAFGVSESWVVLDPMLRVIEVAPLNDSERVLRLVEGLPAPTSDFGLRPPAPILTLADVLEPELCRHLIELFERDGGRESGFMQDVGGRSVENFDAGWKRRSDFMLSDPVLVANIRARIGRRICPEIKKAFQFVVSRIERDLVARYDAETGGHFGPHRDDAGALVAHRRFAVSINLNDAFDGGEISFPEYSPQRFKTAPGAAIVFSGSILHQVSRVTRGRRYVFLTFLFDEDAERVRQANLRAAQEAQHRSQRAASGPAREAEAAKA